MALLFSNMRGLLCGVLGVSFLATLPLRADTAAAPLPWGDLGDGTYRNPILPSAFPEIDATRAGNAYYLVASTGRRAPGLVVLRSGDLVNWNYLGHAVADPSPFLALENPGHPGLRAGTIRWKGGAFRLYFTVPKLGLFVATSVNPADGWSAPVQVWDGAGGTWDDPCPLWDERGQAWMLLHGQDGTHLFAMKPDGGRLELASDRLLDRATSWGGKLYRKDDCFYIVRGEDEGLAVLRSKEAGGPWERRLLLPGSLRGALVEAENGTSWLVEQRDSDGTCRLLPVAWTDGWPIPADAPDAKAVTKPGSSLAIPAQPPESDDEFGSPTLGAQWEWSRPPKPGSWSLAENPGHLRLKAAKPLPVAVTFEPKLDPAQLAQVGGQVVQLIQSFLNPGDFFRAGNIVSQRVFGPGPGDVSVRVEAGGMIEGQIAGLAVSRGHDVATLGIVRHAGLRKVEFADTATRRNAAGPEMSAGAVWFRATLAASGAAAFSYSFDGRTYTPIGDTFPPGREAKSLRIALFTWNGEKEGGHADFGPFRYAYFGPARPDAESLAPNLIP